MNVIDVPVRPPVAWAREPKASYVDGQTVHIDLDGPEAGRASGLVQPARGKARFMGGGKYHGAHVPLTTFDGLRSAHTGPMEFLGDDGEIVRLQCASIALDGGHSMQHGAMNAQQSREFLNRTGMFAELADELILYGTYTPVTEGENKGAMMFCGAAYPDTTVRDAMVVNNTTMSGENWPDPQYGMREVFTGAARVKRTALPYDIPDVLAASLDEAQMQALDQLVSSLAPGFTINEIPEITPMAAMLEESDITSLRSDVADLQTAIATLTEEFAELAISLTTGDDLTLEDRFAALYERIGVVEAAQSQTQQQQRATTAETEAATTIRADSTAR